MTGQTIAMIKWGKGYPALAFNRTYKALRAHCAADVRIACITDDPEGLHQDIDVIPLPDIPLDAQKWTPGMWPKLCMFKDGMFKDGTQVLFVDVDVAIVSDLSELFALSALGIVNIYQDEKTYHAQWFPKLFHENRGGNSSVVGFIAGDHGNIWESFATDPDGSFTQYGNDQNFITAMAQSLRYYPRGWVSSFKKGVAPLPPLAWISGCRPKPATKIVAFHGKPDIDELSLRNNSLLTLFINGFGYVGWVEDYLKTYD